MNTHPRIRTLLLRVGVDPALSGYEYLVEALTLCYKDRIYLKRITGMLYPTLADRFSTAPHSIERCMRHAIEGVSKLNPEGCDILGQTPDAEKGKYTNSQFLALCVEVLKLEDETE